MTPHADMGYAQKGESSGDASPVPLGSKESHDPPTINSSYSALT
ncbi:ISC1913 family transposase, Second ORF [Saccharolobus shibatae]|uniref:ISC1913 family transposase, Second ORF n=1 Tax=Saccharolobus shibatae TaxID=2286 RepID=A0A8F5C0L9_9CREN|nr:ISC1913 family transposase, Second ORF [Saccharolobus shibatae]